jgi:SOS-response transcriptional repressor LexA
MSRQQKILDFIVLHNKDKGYPPTVREITKAVGLQSPSTTHGHLERLRDSGVITWENGTVRTIKLIVKSDN